MAVEPLPAEFEAELQDLDGLLRSHASRTPIPRYIADVVYDATVGLLWPRQSMPVAVSRRVSVRRLAMAAAIVLALVLASLVSPSTPARSGNGSMLVDAAWSPEVEQILLDMPLGSMDGSGATYLPETREVSLDELHGDLLRVIEELQM